MLSPTLFAVIFYFSLKGSQFFSNGDDDDTATYAAYGTLAVNGILLLTYSLGHFKDKFINWLYYLVFAWNTVTLVVTLSTLVTIEGTALYILIATFMFPFFLAIMHSFDVFLMMMIMFIPYVLFLPTFMGWFLMYSLSRTWDLTWGNRPSKDKGTDTAKVALKTKSFAILVMVLLLNFGLGVGLVYLDNTQLLIYISVGLMGVSVCQQFVSLAYYLFDCEHSHISRFNFLSKATMKILTGILFIVTISLLFTGMFTTSWLTRTMDVDFVQNNTNYTVNSAYFTVINDVSDQPIDNDLNAGNISARIFRQNDILKVTHTTHAENNITSKFYRFNTKFAQFANHLDYCFPSSSANSTVSTTNKILSYDYYYNYTVVNSVTTITDMETNEVYKNNASQVWSFVSLSIDIYNTSVAPGEPLRKETLNCVEYSIPPQNVSDYLGFDPKDGSAVKTPGVLPITSSGFHVQDNITVVERFPAGKLNAEFGILYYKYTFETSTTDIVYRNETKKWGSNLIYDVPN
eukprot:Awhi_evm2s6452